MSAWAWTVAGNDVQFVQFGNGLSEHTGNSPTSGWTYLCATDVASVSASQVQANTVFYSTGSNLREYVRTSAEAGSSQTRNLPPCFPAKSAFTMRPFAG